jgi:hypothetical protein
VSSTLPFAPRALFQIFIKTTPHHRLLSFVALCFVRGLSRYFDAFGHQQSFFRLSQYTAAVHILYELPLYIAMPKRFNCTAPEHLHCVQHPAN